MYPNLLSEMARKGIKKKDLKKVIGTKRNGTIYDKFNGKSYFTLDQAFLIQETFFPNHTVDYLFRKSANSTNKM